MADTAMITNLREIERDGTHYYRFSWDAPFGSAAWQNALQLSLMFSNFWPTIEATRAQGVLEL